MLAVSVFAAVCAGSTSPKRRRLSGTDTQVGDTRAGPRGRRNITVRKPGQSPSRNSTGRDRGLDKKPVLWKQDPKGKAREYYERNRERIIERAMESFYRRVLKKAMAGG